MYFSDHSPPHFHVMHPDGEAVVGIKDGRIIRGRLSPRVRKLVARWAFGCQDELMANWDRARRAEPHERIEPLR